MKLSKSIIGLIATGFIFTSAGACEPENLETDRVQPPSPPGRSTSSSTERSAMPLQLKCA